MALGLIRPYLDDHSVALVVLLVTGAFWLIGERRQGATQRSEATEVDGGSRQLLRVTLRAGLIIGLIAPRVLPAATIPYGRERIFWLGMTLVWIGIGLRFWAFRTLGRYFTFTVMTSPDQQVVTAGPYRLLRHPSYAGAIVALAGFGLALGNWVSLGALLVLPTVGLVNRIKVEEAALVSAIGQPYVAFAAVRKRLVPFIW